jgi:hypothetical protein
LIPVLYPEIILHVGDTRDALGNVLSPPTLIAARHGPTQRHFCARDDDLDLGRVNAPIVGQTIVHVLANPVAWARIVPGAAATLILAPTALGFFIAEPGGHFIWGPIPEAALLVAIAPLIIRARPIATVVVPVAPVLRIAVSDAAVA